MSKFFKEIGDLPLATYVKCFGKRCIIIGHEEGLCVLATKDAVFSVPFSQRVELLNERYRKL